MDVTASKPLPAFGFLTALEDPEHGFFGGYLVLSELGRPLEFHCSTPVFPNQAQKILYGATLREYVLGELIGQTLLAKAKLPVLAVLTDLQEMLSVTLVRPEKVGCVTPIDLDATSPVTGVVSSFSRPEVVLDRYRLHGTEICRWSGDQLAQNLAPLASHVDLLEPFERICEAIREAQRMTQPLVDDENETSSAA